MKAFLRNAATRVSGLISGAVTGIGAGFLPGYYHFMSDDLGKMRGDYISGIIYLVFLPYFMVTEIVKGAAAGAKGGFLAGLRYPITLNDRLNMPVENNLLVRKLETELAKPTLSPLFSQRDKEALQVIVEEPIDEQKRKSYETSFAAYKQYLNTTKCPLTGRGVEEIAHPLIINTNNQNLVCERSAFLNLAKDCQQKNLPVRLNLHDAKTITSSDVQPFTIDFFPKPIAAFVREIKSILNSYTYICKTLGLKYGLSERVVSELDSKLVEVERKDSANLQKVIANDVKHVSEVAAPSFKK